MLNAVPAFFTYDDNPSALGCKTSAKKTGTQQNPGTLQRMKKRSLYSVQIGYRYFSGRCIPITVLCVCSAGVHPTKTYYDLMTQTERGTDVGCPKQMNTRVDIQKNIENAVIIRSNSQITLSLLSSLVVDICCTARSRPRRPVLGCPASNPRRPCLRPRRGSAWRPPRESWQLC